MTDVEVANKYFAARKKGDVAGAVALMTDDIVLETPRDKATGKEAAKTYLEKNPFVGEWDAEVKEEGGVPTVHGKNKVMMKTINLKITFTIKDGKVAKVVTSQV